MRIITNRPETNFDLYEPKEQAGFRKRYGASENLHKVKQLTKMLNNYNMPLWLAFIDFKRAFDKLKINAIISGMRNAQKDPSSIIHI